MSNGDFVTTVTSTCPNGPPPSPEVWFTVRVVVGSDKRVNISLNDALVTSRTAHFNTRGRAGVVAAIGHKNIIRFRKFSLCC